MKHRRQPLRRIFRIPAAVGALSLGGLVVALLGEGAWDWAGATLLSSAVLTTVWAVAARRG